MKASTRAGSRGAAAFVPMFLALIFVAPAAVLAADLTIAADPTVIDPSPSPSVDPAPSPTPSPSVDPTPSPTPDPSVSPDPSASATPDPSSSTSPDPSLSPTPDPLAGGDAALVSYYFPQVDPNSGVTIAAVAGITSAQLWSPWRRMSSRTEWVRGLWGNLRAGKAVVGRASWYPSTRGWRGVPAVALPGAWYRPRGSKTQRVEVCAGKRCIVVPVVDFCDCHVNSSESRIADLSRPLVRRLGLKLHKGIYTITMRLVAGPSTL